MTIIIDGNKVSGDIFQQLKTTIENGKNKTGKIPGLAVILIGQDPASQVYVRMKKKRCEQIGIQSFEYKHPADFGQIALENLVKSLNQNPDVHGILCQLPLPKGHDYDEQKIIELIDPKKDVDGFHPMSIGKLMLGLPTYKSCTPYGVCKLIEYYNIQTEGKHVVIVGRSNIVGKPLANMLIQKAPFANATVTVCHSRTKNLKNIVSQADIIIAAIGIPEFITADMVKNNAVVIDVGINRIDDPSSEKGYRLVGDVDYEPIKEKASHITPVPGGVGPMTIAMLLTNTVDSFSSQR